MFLTLNPIPKDTIDKTPRATEKNGCFRSRGERLPADIGENGDFIFSAVPGEAAPVDKDARKAIPHADINCHIAKDTLAYVQVNYDPDFIPEEMMKAILGRASALAGEIMQLEFPGESGRP